MNVQRHAQKLRRKVFEQKLVMSRFWTKLLFPVLRFHGKNIAGNLKKF